MFPWQIGFECITFLAWYLVHHPMSRCQEVPTAPEKPLGRLSHLSAWQIPLEHVFSSQLSGLAAHQGFSSAVVTHAPIHGSTGVNHCLFWRSFVNHLRNAWQKVSMGSANAWTKTCRSLQVGKLKSAWVVQSNWIPVGLETRCPWLMVQCHDC